MQTHKIKHDATWKLTLAALGVVYGDIGTSPLYAMRESLRGIPLGPLEVLGILSLIFWTILILISIKYCIFLLRADNDGEGGILALSALVNRIATYRKPMLYTVGILGAGFMIGDGMLTPAISVISAVEGLHVIAPKLSSWVVPITTLILIGLFSVQSLGSSKVGITFSFFLLIWFAVIAYMGITQIKENPSVFAAINPWYGFHFLFTYGLRGYALLGGVFLVVTGAEALYADMGHFGKIPIRLSWFLIVWPALILNYFGQGALLLSQPDAIVNPFYFMVPKDMQIYLLTIATVATVIASQAVISATFSLVKQAILLGLYPRLPIVQTSASEGGQVYIPQMNLVLAIGTLSLVWIFQNADSLTHAYGIAVNLEMVLTTSLVMYVARKLWHLNSFLIVVMYSVTLIIELGFLGANSQKFMTGGWVPIAFAMVCGFVMYTWDLGRRYLSEHYYIKPEALARLLKQFDYKSMSRIPDSTAIFITDVYDRSGGAFLNFLKISRTLPEKIVLVNYQVLNRPYVRGEDRYHIQMLKPQICALVLNYGFQDTISIPQALYVANERGILPFRINLEKLIYLIEIPNVVASKAKRSLWFYWQEKLFAFLVRNYSANLNIEFYQLPYSRTMAMGTYYII